MRSKLLIILMLGLFASFPSCKKAPLTVGKIVTETRDLPDFNEVYLSDNINLTLVRANYNQIEITTGKNIIDNVTSDVNGSSLNLSNTTALGWIRPYDYQLDATLYYKDIQCFTFASSGNLSTSNQYNADSTDYEYKFVIDGGSGDINLLLNNCTSLDFIYRYGISSVNLYGQNNKILKIQKRSYGIIDARNYDAIRVDANHNSTSDIFISARDTINAEIYQIGNIYYKGNPSTINCEFGEIAQGKLLPLN